MTDAEWLEEIRNWASVTRLEDDDGPTFFLLNRGDRLEAEVERLREVVANLAAREPLRQRRFSNMGSPDSVTECIFCGADDYSGLPVSHKDSCVWAAALAELEGKP